MSLRRVLAGVLPQKQRPETPTTSIYFAAPMASYLGSNKAPVQRLEPNVFLAPNALVIMRHWSGPTRRFLAETPGTKVVYFIDDDLWTLDQDNGLPEPYLERLQRLKQAFDEQLAPRAPTIVSPSAQILSRFPDKRAAQLSPAMIHPMAPLDHHLGRKGPVRLVFSATASHLVDLRALSAELASVLNGNEGLHLTTFLGDQVPEALQLANCTHHGPQSWADYRRTLAAGRFHIGLAPLKATPFNRARSGTRLLDHAAVGAAGLYSAVGPFAKLIEPGQNGMLLADAPGAWGEAVRALVRDRALCRKLAEGGQKSAKEFGDPDRVRRFWRELLGL